MKPRGIVSTKKPMSSLQVRRSLECFDASKKILRPQRLAPLVRSWKVFLLKRFFTPYQNHVCFSGWFSPLCVIVGVDYKDSIASHPTPILFFYFFAPCLMPVSTILWDNSPAALALSMPTPILSEKPSLLARP